MIASVEEDGENPSNYQITEPEDIWPDDAADNDNLVSQAYDIYLTQSESSILNKDRTTGDFSASLTKKDTDTSITITEGKQKYVKECDQQNTAERTDSSVATARPEIDVLRSRKEKSEHGLDKQEQSEKSDNESLFGGDFSDDDPSYIPAAPPVPFLSDSDGSDLIQLDELLNPDIYYEKLKERKKAIRIGIDLVFGKSKRKADENNNDSKCVTISIIEEIFKRSWKIIKPRSRWSTKDPATWKKNIEKRRRAEGLPYETKKKCRDPKLPKFVDCSKCKFQCNDHVSETIREALSRKYWSLDYISKKSFILTHVDIKPIKRVLLNRMRPTRRSYSKQCFFSIETDKYNVCQDFFCKTLSISPSVISDAIKQRNSLGQYSKEQDPRGRREPPNKTTAEAVEEVKQHINSFPCMESHYVRKKLKRKYLDAGLTLTKMHQLYVDECKKKNNTPAVSEMTYRRIFSTEFNLGFFAPKKDKCLLCTKFERANGEERLQLKQEYDEHIRRKEICNQEKAEDKKRAEENENFMSVTFDLQAILQIPSTDVGLLYYSRKLTVYDLTVYENKLPNEAYCFLWNEVHGKRGSAEIGTILYNYLTTCVPKDITEISLFSDTCGGQNRNQYVAAILLWIIMQDTQFNVIEHKFLESGHTYMEADSMHSAIETAQKNCDIYCMSDWVNVCKRARSKKLYKKGDQKISKNGYHVKELKYHEFKDIKTLAETVIINRTKNIDGENVNWLKIKRIKYVKGDPNIYYNYDMSKKFMAIDVTKPITRKNRVETMTSSSPATHRYSTRYKGKQIQNQDEPPPTVPLSIREKVVFPQLKQLYDAPLPISIAKKNDLLVLCDKGVIPEEYHGWFRSLPTEASQVDCLPAPTVSDTNDSTSSESSTDD